MFEIATMFFPIEHFIDVIHKFNINVTLQVQGKFFEDDYVFNDKSSWDVLLWFCVLL